eukprot:6300664-Amphidinium_carterae.1
MGQLSQVVMRRTSDIARWTRYVNLLGASPSGAAYHCIHLSYTSSGATSTDTGTVARALVWSTHSEECCSSLSQAWTPLTSHCGPSLP